MTLQYWLQKYIENPKNQSINFNLGWEYEQQGQTASAAGFYLRSTEFGHDINLQYEALMRIAICFEKQGNRVFTTKGILLRAISLLPKRPEAYFLLTRIYERNKDWQEGYTMAVVAHKFATDLPNTTTDVEYPGKLGFTFEKAVCAWWVGLWNESIDLFKELKDKDLPEMYKTAINNNLNNLQV
jgi:tetratricopeptide (TPR) repeat protein